MMQGLPSERWEQIDSLFEEALARPESVRQDYLRSACGTDAELLNHVTALLAVTDEARSILGESATAFLEQALPELLPPPATDLRAGDVIGRFRILKEIGRGGMGTIYLVERADSQFRKRMAMKVVKRGMDTDEILRRFQHERQILASLEHPNIARLYDGGALPDGRPFLVMEYIEGESITAFCDRRRLTIDERLRLFATVCRAVQYAHQNLVVHRDLKPSNVLVTPDGDIRLLDFGIAKLLHAEPSADAPGTRPWMRLVTPEYASPEQLRGDRITTASDAYSLGIILFELLTGTRPDRTGQINAAVVADSEYEWAPSPSRTVDRLGDPSVYTRRRTTRNALKRSLKGDLDNIVWKAMDAEIDRRYQSAEQLLRDIERHLSGHPVSARAESLGYRLTKFVRRHRSSTAAGTAIFLVTILFGVFSWVQRQETARERDTARLERDKAREVVEFVQDLFDASNPFALEPDRLDTIRVRDFLSRGVEHVQRDLETQPEVQAHMQHVLGRAYLNLGLFDNARSLLHQSLETRRNLHDEPHEDIAQSASDLATVLFRMGEFESARTLYDEALEISVASLGEDHQQTAAIKHSLGVLLKDLGENEASEELHREALHTLRTALGDEHPRITIVLNGLALLLQQQSRFDEAGDLLRESLDLRRRLFGDEHPSTAVGFNNLAQLYHHRRDLENAEAFMRDAIRINLAALGPEHPHIAGNLGVLASILRDKGDHEEAERYYRESIELRRKLFDYESREMSVILNNYASLLRRMERYEEAESVSREALEVTRAALGDEHFGVAIVTGNLAAVLQAKGEFTEAAELYREALEAMYNVWPEGHFRIALLEVNLGNTLLKSGNLSEAERLLLSGFEGVREYGGPDDRRTRQASESLATLYHSLGDTQEALKYERLAAAIVE